MTRFGIINTFFLFRIKNLVCLSAMQVRTIRFFIKNLCLKSTLGTFALLAFLSCGFLLTTTETSFAANKESSQAQNTAKENSVTKFIHSYGVEKITSKKSTELTKAIEDADKAADRYIDKREEFRERCNSFVEEALADLKDIAADIFQWTTSAIVDFEYDNMHNALQVIDVCSQSETPLTDAEQQLLKDLATKADNALMKKEVLIKTEGFGDDIYEHCNHPKNPKDKVCTQFIVNTEENTIMSISGVTSGCEPLPFKLYEARSCLFCPLFKTLFNSIQIASNSSFVKMGKSMSKLILIGLAIWIAFMVLQNVSSMTRQDPFEFVTKLLRNSFKVIIAYFLLKDPIIIYHYIIGPLLKAGFEFGAAFLTHTESVLNDCKSRSFSGVVGGVFPTYLQNYLLCFIEAVQYELATSQAIGSSLMCVSRNAALGNLGPIARVMPDFSMMFQGALIYIISLILSLAYAFYLVDATIQLGIFGILLPFIILCMPFKMTNSYFKTGVGVFMNSWFVFVFMGIVVNIVMELIGQSLTGGKGGLTDIEAAINGNEVRKLQDLLGIGYAGFVVLLACCLFGVKLMMKVTELADQFSGGGLSLGIGNKIGALPAQAATGLAKKVYGTGMKTIKGAANMKVWRGADGKYKSLNDGIRSAKEALGRGTVNGIRGAVGAVFHPKQTYRSVSNFVGKMFGKDRRPPSE